MPDFRFQEMFELAPDDTAYRPIGGPGLVRVEKLGGREILVVEPEALRQLAAAAMRDVSHLFRPGHLAQLQRILDDPEASENDRFVALEMLKNANVSAGMVLPSCQDTGTAIVIGKKGENVFTGADDEAWLSHGVFDTFVNTNLRYSQMAPLSMYDERNTGTQPAGAGRALRHARRGVPLPVRHQGRRLGEQELPVPGDARDSRPRESAARSSTRRSARSAPPRARPITSPS